MKSQFTKQRIKKFLSYYRPHKSIFVMDMLFAALSAVSVLLFPLVSGYITGEVLAKWDGGTEKTLFTAGAVLLVLTIVKIISNIIYAYFGHSMGAKMEQTMREELFAHYEKLSFGFHARNSTGKLLTVISNDLGNMTELFHHAPEDLLMTAIKFMGAFAIMISINVPLTLIVFSCMPILVLIALFTDKIMEKQLLKSKKNLSDMNEHIEDTLSGIRTVKAFGNEKQHFEDFNAKSTIYTKAKCCFYKVEAYFYETMEAYPQFLTMLVVVFGALFIGEGRLNVAVLVTFLLYCTSLAEPVRTMLNFMKLFEEGKASFIRFMDMIETAPTVTECENPIKLSNEFSSIRFQSVSFHYEDAEENVLENLSFEIKSGQTIAFAGASGIGKTTISALIARFYDVTDGIITIDGIDIRALSFESLRENIGIVQQEVYIFNGSIRDNICYGKKTVTQEALQNAAKLANIHDFIQSLEKGYDSIVGTKGIMLSGGQRQRISIARLFLKNPKILILDEATSALDYESEEIVQQSIGKLMENRTSIIIAHRLSTIKNADTIYVLSNKSIVEQGSHAALLEKNQEYARLCKMGRL